jgi:hypothetical protein
VNETHDSQPDEQVLSLRALLHENVSIDLNLVKFGSDSWAIHGGVPYDGEEPLAVFGSYAEARRVLDEVCRP